MDKQRDVAIFRLDPGQKATLALDQVSDLKPVTSPSISELAGRRVFAIGYSSTSKKDYYRTSCAKIKQSITPSKKMEGHDNNTIQKAESFLRFIKLCRPILTVIRYQTLQMHSSQETEPFPLAGCLVQIRRRTVASNGVTQ